MKFIARIEGSNSNMSHVFIISFILYHLTHNYHFFVILTFFPLISKSDIVSINDLTLILKIISQCDDKHFMMLQIKTITTCTFEGREMHYHKYHNSFYVLTVLLVIIIICLDLQNSCYSTYSTYIDFKDILVHIYTIKLVRAC